MIILTIYVIANVYAIYQGFRILEVAGIRMEWENDNDKRFEKYSFNEMFYPSKLNWFTFRWPSRDHFSFKCDCMKDKICMDNKCKGL